MYISDMDEKPVKENIQGVEIHFVKINNMGGQPTMSVLAGYKMKEGPPRRPTPRKVALKSKE